VTGRPRLKRSSCTHFQSCAIFNCRGTQTNSLPFFLPVLVPCADMRRRVVSRRVSRYRSAFWCCSIRCRAARTARLRAAPYGPHGAARHRSAMQRIRNAIKRIRCECVDVRRGAAPYCHYCATPANDITHRTSTYCAAP